MRLAQLARKLSLKPTDIQGFLLERGYTLELNPNSRLTQDQVLMAVRKFDPSLESSIFQETTTAELPIQLTELEEPQSVAQESPVELPADPEPVISSTDEHALAGEPEVIRAPKLELPGLRVIGKIELKEPKKKEPETEATIDASVEMQEPVSPRPARPVRPARRDPAPHQWKNPLEAQRQREIREREEKRQKDLELDKQRRTQKYLKKVKSVPTKPVRREMEEASEVEEDIRPLPKTWLGRFTRWLTT